MVCGGENGTEVAEMVMVAMITQQWSQHGVVVVVRARWWLGNDNAGDNVMLLSPTG